MRKFFLFLVGWLSLLVLPASLSAQNITVTGQVTEAKGAPIPSATAAAKNSTISLATDANGNFSMSVRPNALIIVSATGFRTQIVRAASNLKIRLEEDVAKLDEVVVTGLATTVKRRNLSNAVATISSKELSGTSPAQTFDAALEGKISGAYINANSGAPGGGISVKLRGVTSVYGNTQPLFVVDGVYVDNGSTSAGLNAVTSAQANGSPTSTQDSPSGRIADLSAEDIENIEILKGASAAAIYGSKAAAGVIIITTKRGKQGKTRISVSQDLGFAKARKLLGVRQFTADKAASLSSDSATSAALRREFLDAQSAGHIYDYEREIYGNTGFLRNTVLSISGGSEKTGFYFSAAQKDEGGIVKNTGYRNTSMRVNIDHRITDNIKFGISTNYINLSADRGFFGNDNAGVTTSIALSSTPGFAQLHPDAAGNYPNNPFSSAQSFTNDWADEKQ